MHDSPIELPTDDRFWDEWRLLLALFDASSIVWIGDRWDTGKPRHAANLKPAGDWLLQMAPMTYEHISPCVYKPGSYSRCNANIICRKFLVVESDDLDYNQVGAIFKWLKDAVRLRLRAVTFTGGKSLHGWFDMPPAHIHDQLEIVLPELQCDPAMFRLGQISRLPGVIRRDTDDIQALLYFDGENHE